MRVKRSMEGLLLLILSRLEISSWVEARFLHPPVCSGVRVRAYINLTLPFRFKVLAKRNSCFTCSCAYCVFETMRFDVLVVLGFVVWTRGVLAIGQAPCVAFKSSSTTFPIVDVGKKATPILVSQDDWPGVQRAASDFAEDIQRVTGVKPALTNVTLSSNSSIAFESTSSRVIIVGTLGKSSLIEEVVNRTGLDVSGVRGQWEAFVAREVKNPIEGVGSAYVIVGADKRGTIFGMYDHSEQFGTLVYLLLRVYAIDSDLCVNFRCFSVVLVRRAWLEMHFLFIQLITYLGGLMFRRRNIQNFTLRLRVVRMDLRL